MKIQVSKTFAKFINDTAKELGFKAHASVVNLSKDNYSISVGEDFIDTFFWGDYDRDNKTAKVIMVTYPDNYYACPKYITTRLLNEEYKRGNITTYDGLKAMIREMIEI